MKKVFYLLGMLLIAAVVIVSCQKQADQGPQGDAIEKAKNDCETIQGGNILYSAPHYLAPAPLTTGFDDYGYNYQALKFQGSYFNSYAGGYGLPPYEEDDEAYYQRLVDEGYFPDVLNAENTANAAQGVWWAWPYRDVNLMMKWNEAWISKTDCDDPLDGALDRHFGFTSYIGSGAWLTNHQSGSYLDADGNECNWNYFVKIIAAPADATSQGGYWYAADGTEIGPAIWGAFAIIQEVENDPCAGINGLQYNSPDHSGLGGW